MAQLVCIQGMTKGQTYTIESTELLMGRNETNDILILDNKASRTHCKLEPLGSDVMLTDLKSSNGVLVNKELVKGGVLLKDNDIITIGHTRYQFHQGQADTPSVATKTHTVIDMSNSPTRRSVIPGTKQ